MGGCASTLKLDPALKKTTLDRAACRLYACVDDLDHPGQIYIPDLYDLYDLVHAVGWEPNSLHDLV